MPAVVRMGDMCTGHACFPPRLNDGGSSNVFINGIGAHRQGDHWLLHKCGKAIHDGTMQGGSGSVYVNGKPLARVGDMVSCGSAAAMGSSNVFCGG